MHVLKIECGMLRMRKKTIDVSPVPNTKYRYKNVTRVSHISKDKMSVNCGNLVELHSCTLGLN